MCAALPKGMAQGDCCFLHHSFLAAASTHWPSVLHQSSKWTTLSAIEREKTCGQNFLPLKGWSSSAVWITAIKKALLWVPAAMLCAVAFSLWIMRVTPCFQWDHLHLKSLTLFSLQPLTAGLAQQLHSICRYTQYPFEAQFSKTWGTWRGLVLPLLMLTAGSSLCLLWTLTDQAFGTQPHLCHLLCTALHDLFLWYVLALVWGLQERAISQGPCCPGGKRSPGSPERCCFKSLKGKINQVLLWNTLAYGISGPLLIQCSKYHQCL